MTGLSLFLCAALGCFIACLALMPLARRTGLVDRPAGRKQHIGDVPLIGGICIFLVFCVGAAAQQSVDWPLLAALFLLISLGVLDDKYDIPALWKLGGQIMAALIVCLGSGVIVNSLGTLPSGNELLLGVLAMPITVIALVGLVNAMNMIDGIDGLAGGLALLALAHLVIAMQLIGKPVDPTNLAQTLIICGALSGFLILNLSFIAGRKVFLGDAGSMMLGLFIGVQLIEASQRQPLTDTLPTSLVPWMVAVPVIDTLRLIFTRLRQGRSPLSPDRTHMHHILLDRGISPLSALAVLLFLATILFWLGWVLGQVYSWLAGGCFIVLTLLSMIFAFPGQKQSS